MTQSVWQRLAWERGAHYFYAKMRVPADAGMRPLLSRGQCARDQRVYQGAHTSHGSHHLPQRQSSVVKTTTTMHASLAMPFGNAICFALLCPPEGASLLLHSVPST